MRTSFTSFLLASSTSKTKIIANIKTTEIKNGQCKFSHLKKISTGKSNSPEYKIQYKLTYKNKERYSFICGGFKSLTKLKNF